MSLTSVLYANPSDLALLGHRTTMCCHPPESLWHSNSTSSITLLGQGGGVQGMACPMCNMHTNRGNTEFPFGAK